MAQTLLEYVTSLHNQGIDGNSKPSIYELVEKWKKENPQPKVEETENAVDKNAEVSEPNNANNPFAERAQQYEQNENQQKAYEEYKKKVESVAKPEETYSGYDGDLEYKYTLAQDGPPTYYQRKKGSSDEWTAVNQQEDQDNWYDIGAKVFKHFPYDETAAEEAQSLLNSSRGFNNRINLYKKQGAEVDDDEIDIDPEEAAFVEKIYKENVYVTDDQQVEIDDKVNVFMDVDPNIDFSKYGGETYIDDVTGEEVKTGDINESDIVEDLKEQFKGSGIKISEAVRGEDFVQVELPNGETKEFRLNDTIRHPVGLLENERKELQAYLDQSYKSIYDDYKNKAIAEVAEAQGLTPDQLDVNANANAINNKIAALRTDDLKAEQRVENLENYIEDLGTDFNIKGGVNYLLSKLGPPIFNQAFEKTGDITDVFQKTETQKRIEQYEDIRKSNIDKRSKKIELFLAGGSDLLKDLNKQAIAISKGNYQTPAQVTEANKQLAAIKQQSEDVQKLIEQEYDKYTEYIKGNKDNQAFLNKLSRNYGTLPIIVNNIKASTVDMGLGVAELGSQAFELFEAVGDEIDEAVGVKGTGAAIAKTNPLTGIFSAFASVMPEFEDEAGNKISFKDKAFDIAESYAEGLRADVAEAKSVGDIKDFGDFSTWFATTTGSLIPQVTAMVAAPYTGLALVTASAGGSKFMEYKDKMEASEEAYLQALGLSKGATEEEIKKAKDKYIADGGDPNALPELVNYSTMEMWGGAMLNMGLEATTGRFISLPLAKGKSILGPLFKRTAAINNPATRNTFNQTFKNTLRKGAVHIGDAKLEGFEEGFIGIGDKWYQRHVLGEDVNIFEGFWDNFSAGFVGGGYFKAPGIIQSYLTPVQTPGDVSNITGLQNEIKSINNSIIENPKMSAKTREILENKVADKTVEINNSINNSLNIYTEMNEADFNTLGVIDQQLTNLTKQINVVAADPGITTGKEQLIEDLTNAKNELTGQKNQLLDTYVKKDLEGKISGGRIIGPVIQAGADVAAEQLGSGIQRFDNTQDLLGGIESLKAQGVQVNAKTDADGEILDAADQDYGLIATLPDGTKQIIINEASSQADGVIPADKHEVLHLAAAKMDPAKKVQMGTDLLNSLENDPNIEISDRVRSLLDSYKKDLDDGTISEADFYEEVMAVTSDGLTDGGVNIKDIGLFKSIGDKILETIGWKQSFKEGTNVINFLKDFNADIIKGEGLSQEVLSEVDMDLETEVDLGVVKSKKLPPETETYMELDNNVLQQGLNNAIQNKTDQQFPIAQAVVEKNWPLISKSLNINNQQEMDAAKEVVIDQVLGQFEGSGQGKYGPRKTSALAGFDLEGGAQVSTYLAETIRTRKPEIDAAIQDRTGGPGIQADQIGDVAVETEVTEVETTKPLPSETTTYSDTVLSNVNTDKAGLEANITEAITTAYGGRTDVKFAETRNIPQEVADIYATAFGLNPETIVDKRRNFSKKDADGLNAAKRFLLANSQADYNRLPKTEDVEGKGTFIPKNVKDALYTDGKLTGTLKDYQDIIRIKPEKAIYRDRVGQTIRGLLNTHIRNRILETASPDAAVRQATGATFSKKAPVVKKPKKKIDTKKFDEIARAKDKNEANKIVGTETEINEKNRSKVQEEVLNSIEKYGLNENIFNAARFNNSGAKRTRLENGDVVYDLTNGETIPGIPNGVNKNGVKQFKQPTLEQIEAIHGEGVTLVADRNRLYYGINDPAYIKAREAARKNNKDGQKIFKRVPVKNAFTKKGIEQAKINMDILEDSMLTLEKAVADGMPLSTAAVIIEGAYQSTNGLIKVAAPFKYKSTKFEYADDGKISDRTGNKFREEHSPPASVVGASLLLAVKNGNVKEVMSDIKDNFIQIQLSKKDDTKLDKADLSSILPEGTSILTPNIAAVRLAAANIDLNSIVNPLNGKTLAEEVGLPIKNKADINVESINYQNKLLVDVAKGDLTIADAKIRLKKSLPVQKSKKIQADNFAENIGPEIVTPEMTAEQQKTVMVNSLETRVQASKKTPKPKGISIFDFDDTLAKTKEKVIVNMPDGSVNEISAAEFAKEAGNLTEIGAEFDFSNFENVAEGTAEGPLADLARKRQGKFGSGDIFVLTARPNSAGPAIQQFLKSIGINIPLSNITGLADGSPQAKVDFVLNKTAEGYNDFYFADDSFANVKAVSQILDAVDIKNKVEQALPKEVKLNNDFNKQLEEVTGKEAFKKYSDARARLEGQQKDKGLLKRFINQFKITPSADDFMGLMYAFAGKGEQGNKHLKFIKDNLIDPYNKAEQELLSAKVRVANDFAALKKQFPNLKSKRGKNPLLEQIGVGPYTKSQAVRVYNWAKQGLEIPGMSKRDIDALVKAVEQDNELNVFADELGLIQKSEQYPAPEANWLAGDIKTDILRGLDTTFRKQLMSEFNENSDIIFSPENLNKIEAIYGSKYREALEDSLRRMKSGSNRPVFVGSGARIVNEMMDWLNSSVGAVMFLNMRSGLLQMISNVNFINWGDNNMYNAAKAFASKDYFPTVLKLMNSDYLVNRRDGLKINVNEAELADAGRKGGIKGVINYILDKGFAITRIMDTLAIATGGATFFINRKAALQNRVNEKTGKLYTEAEAEQQAFDDFYAIAEETQQSSNPSKISQQQASFAGRIILSFQNVTMQYNRKTKKSIQDLYNRRKKPGMTQRESDLSNMSSIIYYVGMQNLLFQGLQQGLFALAFDDDEEDNEKEKANAADIINGMSDSLLFGLGFGGAIVSTVKNILMRVADEKEKKTTQYRDIIWDVFNLSPVLDSKVRKLRTAAKTFDWNMKEIKKRGWSIDNPAYLAISQVISATTNLPIDRALQKLNNMRQATDEQTKTWQRVALFLGWSGWNFGLPYWGRQSTIDKEAKDLEKVKENYRKQVKKIKSLGFTKKIPLSGPNHYKPKGELGVDYVQVERPSGEIQYYIKP